MVLWYLLGAPCQDLSSVHNFRGMPGTPRIGPSVNFGYADEYGRLLSESRKMCTLLNYSYKPRQSTRLTTQALSTYPHNPMFDIAYSGTFLIQSCSR